MRVHLNNYKNKTSINSLEGLKVTGLDTFMKDLEKYFFSKVVVDISESDTEEMLLFLELKCKLNLKDLLLYFNSNTWGYFNEQQSALSNSIENLRKKNNFPIEIDEISIYLQDTVIFIDRIYRNSIPEQINKLFRNLDSHYAYIIKNRKEIPFEIYMPVFEESRFKNYLELSDMNFDNLKYGDYYKFWGLYYESQEDASIYDLDNLSVISGDLFMLNQ